MGATLSLDDLILSPGPGIPDGLVIPGSELEERFSKSPGPGGQSVNTTDSRVELVFDAATSRVLTGPRRDRVLRALGSRVVVVASEHRSQHRNRITARRRLAAKLREALVPPPTRVPTKPSKASRRRRVDSKRRRGQVKSLRGRVRE